MHYYAYYFLKCKIILSNELEFLSIRSQLGLSTQRLKGKHMSLQSSKTVPHTVVSIQ